MIMNGLQHFMLAEQCLSKGMHDRSPVLMDAALIHAQLATAAAMFGMVDTDEPDTPIYDAMTKAAAEPLVPCAVTLGELECKRPMGHIGMHESGAVTWSTTEEMSAIELEHQADETESEMRQAREFADDQADEAEPFRVPRFIPAH